MQQLRKEVRTLIGVLGTNTEPCGTPESAFWSRLTLIEELPPMRTEDGLCEEALEIKEQVVQERSNVS